MGQVASVIKAFSCDSCSKYVFNDMSVRSKCFNCCECDIETEAIDLPEGSDSDISVQVDGCCRTKI